MKMRTKGLLFTGMLMLLAVILQAQQPGAIITGQILSNTQQPIPDAAVTLKGTSIGTYTNSNGKFKLEHVKPGKYILLVTMLNFKKTEKAITVTAGSTLIENILLEEESVSKEGVTVTAQTHTRELKESGFAVNAIDTKAFANTTADMNSVLNRTTGVRIREQGGTGSNFNFSINGLSGKAVRFFIDGIPMEVMGSSMTLNNIPVNLAERIEVYKGVLPVSLGADALGGAVNLVTNQQVKNYLDASYSFGSFNTHRAAVTGQITGKKTGLIGRVSAFYNYSDNDYKMRRIKIYDEAEKVYVRKDFRRFHDQYRSTMAQGEIGVMNKKWADVFFIGAGFSATDREIQTGVTQEKVFGAATQDGTAFNTSLRYKKTNLFTKGLDLNVFASHSEDKSLTTDTSGYQYFWDGSRVSSNRGEISSIKALTHISRPRNFARVNLSYELSAVHSFNLNYTFDQITNKTYNELLKPGDDNPGKIGKHILGLAYQQNLLEGRWTNTFFGKYYGMSLKQPIMVSSTGEITSASDFNNYYGYGVASRFKITSTLGIKASVEKAYRLQEVGEIFGNGSTEIANPSLKPEHSTNVNAGAFYTVQHGPHRILGEAGWFYRNAADFIFAVVYQSNNGVSKYQNTSKVKVTGLEADVQYDYLDLFHLGINASYQNAINNTKYALGSSSGTIESTYKNKIPNQPWMFGNATASIGRNNLLGKNTRIQLNWDLQYVHWFYLEWEALGAAGTNSKVPDQYIQNMSVTYSLQNGKYNISAECRNLTDGPAFDNYRLQKPGRAFSVKLRYFIK